MKCPKCETVNAVGSKFCRECATSLPPDNDSASLTRTLETSTGELTRGTLFAGRYEVIEELGAGGMGRVYRVFDKKIEEEVALKLIRPEIAAGKRTVERFRNEIKTARKITHKNVCRTHDLGEEGKGFFITMEYVRGEDLKSFLRRSRTLSVGKAISIARQVAEGLGEAHRLGIVHRDLKPGNIMIDKDGNAKVMDFGIARSLAGGAGTALGAIVGTPEYMSPEQVEGKTADARADIYALGVILFEMVTGRLPFEGDTSLAVAHMHKYEPSPDPRTLNPKLPAALGRLILRCLTKDREKRYQTTGEILAELESIESALPAAERAPAAVPARGSRLGTSKTITVRLSPKKLLIPAAAVVLAAVAIYIALDLIPGANEKPSAPTGAAPGQASVAVLYFKNNTGDKGLDLWRKGLNDSLITKLAQARNISILDRSQIFAVLTRLDLAEKDDLTPGNLQEIARRGPATHLVRGTLSKAGDRFRIDLTLQSAAGLQIVASESADGTGEESILEMVDSLASRLMADLGVTADQAGPAFDNKTSDFMTNSFEAYKLYIEGHDLAIKRRAREAISSLERAVAIDPEFTMAYAELGSLYWFVNVREKWQSNFTTAFELRDRVPERERLFIEAQYLHYISEDNWDKAIETYGRLLSLYPSHFMANGELGFIYWKIDEWDKAIERYEVNRRQKWEDAGTYQILAYCYQAAGHPEKAPAVLRGYLDDIGDNDFIRANLVNAYVVLGDWDKAGKEVERLPFGGLALESRFTYLLNRGNRAAVEDFLAQLVAKGAPKTERTYRLWDTVSRGRTKDAVAAYSAVLKGSPGQGDGRTELEFAGLLEKTGDLSQALAVCENSLALARKSYYRLLEYRALYRKGLILARMGSFEQALATAEELRQLVERGASRKRARYYEALMGMISLLRGDHGTAQVHLRTALSSTGLESSYLASFGAEFLDHLGEAYEKAGQWSKAKETYEQLLVLRSPARWCEPASSLAASKGRYKLGRVLEGSGDRAGAAARYREFLEYWKDADPGLSEVEDAKRRLAAL